MRFPTPGDLVAGAGRVMQRTEDFVSDTFHEAVEAVTGQDNNNNESVTVTDPNRPGQSQQLQGVVSRQEFNDYKRKVAEAFSAARDDVASLRAYGTDGENGMLYAQDGGGGGGMDPLMLILLLQGSTSTTSSLTSNPLLLILLMQGSGGRNGGGLNIAMLLALGLV